MARLSGYALKINFLADHTYVKSDDGFVWPCWGRSAGGHEICAKSGDSTRANCLSQTDSHAGILYGITGVCHQTANRILYPAQVLVSKAKGFWASMAIYGLLATSTPSSLAEWQARKARCMPPGASVRGGSPPAGPGPPKDPAGSPSDRALLARVDAIYAGRIREFTLDNLFRSDTTDFLALELRVMADFRLGEGSAAAPIRQLAAVQATVTRRKRALDSALIAHGLRAAQYAERVNGLVSSLLKESVKLLGPERHQQLFDLAPGEEPGLVDPKILTRYH